MKNQKGEASASSGMGIFGVLGIVFIMLKLVGVIDWSWWLVLLPFYGGLLLVFTVVGIFLVIAKLAAR